VKYYESILEIVGNTPLVRLHKVAKGLKPTVLAKLEQAERPAVDVLHLHDVIARIEPHPGHAVVGRQMRLFGGMVSFEVAGEAAALRILERLKLFALAESLGAVESLAEHPARMTHASVPAAERKRAGVGEGLIRLSVGVEDVADLIADLESALADA
jgi:cystathionine beta-lyase/cystathionine gamma-synthase